MFTLQVIISFLVGGLFIALQTLFGERVPLYWRGTVLTIPSTMAISFLFIGLTKSAGDIPAVATFFPAAIALAYLAVMMFYCLRLLIEKILVTNPVNLKY